MPDLTGLALGELLAICTAVGAVPCCYLTRRKKERLRSKRGAWAWATVDGGTVWIFMAVIVAALWIDQRLAMGFGVHLAVVGVGIVLSGLASAIAAKRIAPPLMRYFGA